MLTVSVIILLIVVVLGYIVIIHERIPTVIIHEERQSCTFHTIHYWHPLAQ